MDFTYDDEQQALREAVRGLLGKAYADYETRRRTAVAEDPGFDERPVGPARRDGRPRAALRRGARRHGRRPGRDRHRAPRSSAGCSRPSRSSTSVVLAGGLVAAAGSAEQKADLLGALSRRRAGARRSPHAEPGGALAPAADGVTATADGDAWTLDGVKEPVLARRPRRPAGRQRRAARRRRHRALPGRRRRRGADPHRLPDADGGRAARVAFDGTAATPLGDRDADRAEHRARSATSPGSRPANEALGAMEASAARDDRLPQEPQAVRRHAQHLPGADLPRRRHVRLARAGAQHRDLGDDGARRRRPRRGRRRGRPGRAAGQPRRAPHRPGGDPAARRHRHDRGVRRRHLHRPPRPRSTTCSATATTTSACLRPA